MIANFILPFMTLQIKKLEFYTISVNILKKLLKNIQKINMKLRKMKIHFQLQKIM